MTIDTEMADVARVRASLEFSARDFERLQASLLASDGKTPIFQKPEHDRRLAEALQPLQTKAHEAERLAETLLERAELRRLDGAACPSAGLGDDDLRLAEGKRWLVQDEVERLPVAALAQRVRWAAAKGDTATRFLYLRLATQRWTKESAKDPAPQDIAVLGQALRDTGALSPRDNQAAAEGDALKEAAVRLRIYAGQTLRHAKGEDKRPVSTL